MSAKLEVVSPLGATVSEQVTSLAPRLDTLEGKTVCEIWNGGFMGDVAFPIIEDMLRKRFPTVRVIPYTEFPLTTMVSMEPTKKHKVLDAVRKAILEKGCDAVITGNGA